MPLEDVLDVLDNLADVKRRVAMIPFTPDRVTATKEALRLTVSAVEHLVQLMAEAEQRRDRSQAQSGRA